MLAANVSALDQRLTAEANLAEVIAADPRVRADVAELLELARRTAGDADALKTAPAQAHLRDVSSPVVSRQENAGYVVIDPCGLIIARTIDDRIGERVVLSVADVAAQALAGHRAFLPPTPSIASRRRRWRSSSCPCASPPAPSWPPSPSASVPEQMAAILNASRLGESGETYAVDADGRMVTETRFSEQVAKLGLLPAEAGGRTTAVLEVRDPGTRLAGGTGPADAAQDLAPHLGGGGGGGRAGRRQHQTATATTAACRWWGPGSWLPGMEHRRRHRDRP